ncbi:MAG: DUF4013 domain-containing protein [Methanobrevibacter sp.]|jgi:hypothetical protein|nr:DUF4013 domain-containing protein [Candidatus Methanoflexus mossambicus]
MDISEIFKDSLKFPLSDYKKFLIYGVIIVLSTISAVLLGFKLNIILMGNGIIEIIVPIIAMIFMLIATGYEFSIIRNTIKHSDELPEFDLLTQFIEGIKICVIEIIYGIIPTIITFILCTIGLTGFIVANQKNFMFLNATNNPALTLAAIQNTFTPELAITALIIFIIAAILFILFGLLCHIGIARYADKGNFGSAFDFKQIFETISQIGWGKYIIWIITVIIIMAIIFFIGLIISLIPYVGVLLTALIIGSFSVIFFARSLGLIYNSKDN